MPFPTPSLPAAIREALDEYETTAQLYYGHNAPRAEFDAFRTALEAHLLALVAERDEAEAYIGALRGPLLYYYGTTDPELLAEEWKEQFATPPEDTTRDE